MHGHQSVHQHIAFETFKFAKVDAMLLNNSLDVTDDEANKDE